MTGKKSKVKVSKKTGFVSKFSNTQGGPFSPPTDPISVSLQPWNHTYVYKSTTGEVNFKVSDIIALLKKQLSPDQKGFGVSALLYVKISQIMMWNLTGRALALTPLDITNDGGDELGGYFDAGGTSSYPRLGYVWPRNCQETILDGASHLNRKIFHALSGSSDTYVFYIKTQWKFAGPATFAMLPKTTLEKMSKTLASIETVDKQTYQVTSDMHKTMMDNTPGLVSRTIDGVVKTAEVVAVAGIAPFQDIILNEISKIHQALEHLRIPDQSKDCSEFSEAEDLGESVHDV